MDYQSLEQWIKEAEKYEFCKSYGSCEGLDFEFVKRPDDFYITLLSMLHEVLGKYLSSQEEQYRQVLLHIAKGLIIYSQKETKDDFWGVRAQNNQLYVAAIYYLCDYPAISAWVLNSEVSLSSFDADSAKLLYYLVSGGKGGDKQEDTEDKHYLYKLLGEYLSDGDEPILQTLVDLVEEKYSSRNFESPTDFYMTSVLRCVLLKFEQTNLWRVLRDVDDNTDWAIYIRHSHKQHILSFLPSQRDAIDRGLLNFSGSFSLKMPTSAGKSYITELLIYQELQKNPQAKILYLAPLRALSRELRERFTRIHDDLGFTFATKYGGSSVSTEEETFEEAQLIIATPESFMSLESLDKDTIDKITLVICDEGQLLDDFTRGINYELLLTRLRKHDNIRFLFISAIIPNINVINNWLKGNDNHIGRSTYRPSKLRLTEASIERNKINLNVYDDNYKEVVFRIDNFVTKDNTFNEFFLKEDETVDTKPAYCSLALQSLHAGPVLLFSTAKSTGVSCTGLAGYLCDKLEHDKALSPLQYVSKVKELNKIIEYAEYNLGTDHILCKSLHQGFAVHHGDIPQELREKVETAYNNGIIRLIIANTTLAEGVNLPIKTIILANMHDPDPARLKMFLPNSRIKNIIGRVGRAGRERYGTIIVPPSNYGYLLKLVKEALNPDDSVINKVRGTLYDLIVFLQGRNLLSDENDVNQLLNVTTFADAIDEMILRSTENDIEHIDIETLASNSLAYTLADAPKQTALKRVFSIRYDKIKSSITEDSFRLFQLTGLNVRDMSFLNEKIETIDFTSLKNMTRVDDENCISIIIDVVTEMPTVVDDRNLQGKRMQKLIADEERLKVVTKLWMTGLTYHDISHEIEDTVDNTILLVKYIQGIIHDRASSMMQYLLETELTANQILKYWADYLRLGINTRLMYELHGVRIPERIQLHAIQRYCDANSIIFNDFDFLEVFLKDHCDDIVKYMSETKVPVLSLENFQIVVRNM